MRRLFFVALLLAATSASAGWIEMRPKTITLLPGQSAAIDVVYVVSGTVWPPYEWNTTYSFTSDRPDVLDFDPITFTPPEGGKVFYIRALKPGTAHISIRAGGTPALLTVTVLCDRVGKGAAVLPVVTTQPNVPVTLRLTISGMEQPIIDWYGGQVGDYRNPLPLSGSTIDYTPTTTGTHLVWARVQDECSSLGVAFRVDVLASSRKRASRR